MIQSRIREIRKSKGLTLQQVAERTGTTAQTIGRLETGMRTLSLGWVQRIAEALETDSSELLTMPGSGDIDILSAIGRNGTVRSKTRETLALRLLASAPTALRVSENVGTYRKGDTVICNRLTGSNIESADGRDCLVQLADGNQIFGRLVRQNARQILIVPPEPGGQVRSLSEGEVAGLAAAVALIRQL